MRQAGYAVRDGTIHGKIPGSSPRNGLPQPPGYTWRGGADDPAALAAAVRARIDPVVLRLAGRADGGPVAGAPRPAWLRRYDPEAHGGRGHAWWTGDRREALVLPNAEAARKLWMRVPDCRPKRADGRPNRPLTAYSMLIEHVPDRDQQAPE
jgi:hypothetical protein